MIDKNLNPNLNPDLNPNPEASRPITPPPPSPTLPDKPDRPITPPPPSPTRPDKPDKPPGEAKPDPIYDRDKFFDAVRADPFQGSMTQGQVDGCNYLLDMWETHFAPWNPNDGTMMLAYVLATAFHETGAKMAPVPEIGEGAGHSYGEPAGPYGNCYYGRGYVQLTWEDNYIKGEGILRDKYAHPSCEIHQFPDKMLEHEPSALILMDGSYYGWFTGVSLQTYFNTAKGIEDTYDAWRVINGVDKAETIANYYWAFKRALT